MFSPQSIRHSLSLPSSRLSGTLRNNFSVLAQSSVHRSRSVHSSPRLCGTANMANYKYYDEVVEGSYIPTDPNHKVVKAPPPVFVFEGNVSHSGDALAGARRIFGGRLSGEKTTSSQSSSRYISHSDRSVNIAGVLVPAERPKEPDNCCMSGCINCVWELYNDELRNYRQQRRLAAKALMKKGGVWPLELNPPIRLLPNENLPKELRKAGNTSAAIEGQTEEDEPDRWESVSMSVFADLEDKLKKKHERMQESQNK